MIRVLLMLIVLFFSLKVYATDNVVNVYTWAEEIPDAVIKQFEKETGIKVNYATFDSNEVMYAKLRANRQSGYDVIEPSNYYIQRLIQQHRLENLDKTQLTNIKNIDPFFAKEPYDPESAYSIPFTWGVTGLYVNQNYFKTSDLQTWNDLLNKKFLHQLMILDDSREVFAIALRMLGFSGNDTNPEHIKAAYLKLKELSANVKLFNTDAVLSILIDEDATAGIAWNADIINAHQENTHLQFIFPKEGFTIWIDNLAILNNAPHRENAYRFVNFLLRPDIAKEVSLKITYATANLAGRNLLPDNIKNNPVLYPSYDILRRGEVQMDIGDKAFALLEKYWEQLKMGG